MAMYGMAETAQAVRIMQVAADGIYNGKLQTYSNTIAERIDNLIKRSA